MVRAGLSDPGTSVRSISDFCQDFPKEEARNISHTSVAAARDAFAQIIKEQSRAEVASHSGKLEGLPFFVTHIHDEAIMRLRSTLAGLPHHVARARYTKVQNNVVRIHLDGETFEWYTELQALAEKSAPTVAQAILQVIKEIIQTARSCRHQASTSRLRVIHMLTGDAIPTNLAAAKHVLEVVRRECSHGHLAVQYRLLVWVCASHQSNPVVQIAILGRIMKHPVHGDTIAAACSRLYKYLLPSYTEEFSKALWAHLDETMQVQEPNGVNDEAAQHLQQLYGKEVLPDNILSLFNVSMTVRVHAGNQVDREQVVREAFRILSQRLLLVEERPVVTRFFLFTTCVWTLLCMKLLALPSCIFSLNTSRIREENGKRLQRFKAFYDGDSADQLLRRSGLCLQLTHLAVSISSKESKHSSGEDALPLLVRIGRAEVQRRTSQRHLSLGYAEIC